jgi:hypothetical protein
LFSERLEYQIYPAIAPFREHGVIDLGGREELERVEPFEQHVEPSGENENIVSAPLYHRCRCSDGNPFVRVIHHDDSASHVDVLVHQW